MNRARWIHVMSIFRERTSVDARSRARYTIIIMSVSFSFRRIINDSPVVMDAIDVSHSVLLMEWILDSYIHGDES